MECLFINLDKDVERRALVESNFAEVAISGWSLTRFPAANKDDMEKLNIQGGVTLAERACFSSHRALLQSRLYGPDSILIVEDDVLFHKDTFSIIDNMLLNSPSQDWDLVFLDVCVPDVKNMIDLYRGMKARPSEAHFSVVNLKDMMFAGSTAYIVNGRSKGKVWRLLEYQNQINIPYDLYIRELIRYSHLNAYVIFPFVSSLSRFSEQSTINAGRERRFDRALNQFRHLMWIGRSLDSQREAIEDQFAALCDDELRSFSMVLGALLGAEFK